MASRVYIVRERVLAIKRENPELPVKDVADLANVPLRMANRILGVPRPPAREKKLRRDYFTWKRAEKGCAVLAKILHEKHPLRAA